MPEEQEEQQEQQEQQEQGKPNGEPKVDEKPAWYVAMSDEAKVEYDKLLGHSRKHEGKAKALGEKLKPLETEVENLRKGSLNATELAVEEALVAERAKLAKENAPKLVQREFRAQAAEMKITANLKPILDRLDATSFLDDSGEVDEEAVKEVLAGLAPKAPERQGPGTTALGRRLGVTAGGTGISAGAEMYAARHPNKNNKTASAAK